MIITPQAGLYKKYLSIIILIYFSTLLSPLFVNTNPFYIQNNTGTSTPAIYDFIKSLPLVSTIFESGTDNIIINNDKVSNDKSIVLNTIYPYDYRVGFEHPGSRPLMKPFESIGDYSCHILGTNDEGIDVFAELLYGLRYTIEFSFIFVLFQLLLGVSIGSISGLLGGITDKILLKMIELFEIFPGILFLLIFSSAFEMSNALAAIVLSVFSWTSIAKVLRSEVIQEKSKNYIIINYSYNHSYWLHFKNILPNIFNTIISLIPFSIIYGFLALIIVDFIGLRSDLSTPSISTSFAGFYDNILLRRYWLIIPHLIVIISFIILLTQMIRKLRVKNG